MSSIAIGAAGAQRDTSLVSFIGKLFAGQPKRPAKATSLAQPHVEATGSTVGNRACSAVAYECDGWLRWTGV